VGILLRLKRIRDPRGAIMSRVTQRFCDRCGACVTDRPGSIVEVKAGDLVDRIGETVDLCPVCSDGFTSWLRSARQAHQDGPGEAIAATAVASMATG